MPEIEQPILDYISGVVAETGGAPVTRETPLLEAGILDSINLVRLVQFLEPVGSALVRIRGMTAPKRTGGSPIATSSILETRALRRRCQEARRARPRVFCGPAIRFSGSTS